MHRLELVLVVRSHHDQPAFLRLRAVERVDEPAVVEPRGARLGGGASPAVGFVKRGERGVDVLEEKNRWPARGVQQPHQSLVVEPFLPKVDVENRDLETKGKLD